MKKFVRICERIQYLGFLGIFGFIFNVQYLQYLWLLWLFGLVSLFYNYHITIQSLLQIGGMIITAIKYGSAIPSIGNYQCEVEYSLPFQGEWTVVNGGIDKATSHSWEIQTQRYAYDFIILDKDGRSYQGLSTQTAAYYCYGKEILAPADGEVVEVSDQYSDSMLLEDGQVECSAKDIRGNYIIIRHADREFSLLAHLMPQSVQVKAGDRIKRGQHIANCGNSGNTSEPHLHFQLQDSKSFYNSAGLPIKFSGIHREQHTKYNTFDSRPIPSVPEDKSYITRGQVVTNIQIQYIIN